MEPLPECPERPRLGRWQQVLADALDQNLAIGVRAAVADHWVEPPPGLNSPPHDEPPPASPPLVGPACVTWRAVDAHAYRGDRNYLVQAKPNKIMNDTRLRGLAVAGSDAAGRKSPHNHAQTARNLRRSLRSAAAGARVMQVEGLDSKSAADVAAALADALEELHGLQRRLDRRIRRDRVQ